MVAINVCSRETACPGNVDRCAEVPFHHYIVYLVVGYIWVVPSPPSGPFVRVECVGHTEVVNCCKFKSLKPLSFVSVLQ